MTDVISRAILFCAKQYKELWWDKNMKEPTIELEMIKTVHMIKRQIDERITQTIDRDLTVPQCHVIGYISRRSKFSDVFQKDIETEFGLHRSSVSLMLNHMEANGFIQRISVVHDARLKKIVLTEKALQLQFKIEEGIMESNEKILKGITEEEQEKFIKLLKKMQKNLG